MPKYNVACVKIYKSCYATYKLKYLIKGIIIMLEKFENFKLIMYNFLISKVFVACWSPYVIFDLLQVYDQIPRTQTNIAIASFVQSLAALNSATNPLIYCFFSLDMPKVLE